MRGRTGSSRSKKIELTDRERDVLDLSLTGSGATAIARELGFSKIERVKHYKRKIKDKLGLPAEADTEAMLSAARAHGLVP